MFEMWIGLVHLHAGLVLLASSLAGLAWATGQRRFADLAVLHLGRMPTSRAELRRAYRLVARAAHPDVGGSKEAFLAVAGAFERLSKIVGAR